MSDHTGLPSAVDGEAVLELAGGHHARHVRALGPQEADGHLMKVYALEAPGRALSEQDVAAATQVAGGHLQLAHEREVFTRQVLDGEGTVEDRLTAWSKDVLEGPVR